MLNLAKWVVEMYMPLLPKMPEDSPSIMFTKVNFELLCDINLHIFLYCLLPC
jgi:hypothetical protein